MCKKNNGGQTALSFLAAVTAEQGKLLSSREELARELEKAKARIDEVAQFRFRVEMAAQMLACVPQEAILPALAMILEIRQEPQQLKLF